jgi:hypothetical protein
LERVDEVDWDHDRVKFLGSCHAVVDVQLLKISRNILTNWLTTRFSLSNNFHEDMHKLMSMQRGAKNNKPILPFFLGKT